MADAVEEKARGLGKDGITCRVAVDLESNLFWRSIGYIPVAQKISTWLNQKESQSRRSLWVYERLFNTIVSGGLPQPVLPCGVPIIS